MESTYTVENPSEIPHLIRSAVADCHGVETQEISEPLGLTIDTNSLQRLWWPSGRFPQDGDGTLSFDYYDCRVTVTSDGRVTAKKDGYEEAKEYYLENRDGDQ
jgi:hypothetical protein